MFLTKTKAGYDRDSQQYCHGLFLIVFEDPNGAGRWPELRGLVRHVQMKQLGHWMMGHVTIGGASLSLSGTYGSDGLPFSIDRHFLGVEDGQARFAEFTDEQKKALWDQLVPIPSDLQEVFWAGGGHNTSGSEGPSFRDWGKRNLKSLRKVVKPVI